MGELLVFIIEWASAYPTKERKRRIMARGKHMQERGEGREQHMTIEEQCEDQLLTEFKGAILGQICNKMPQCIK